MDASQEKKFWNSPATNRLVDSLEDLTTLYKQLLDVIRKEKEILIKADIDELQASNAHKEQLLNTIKNLDLAREKHAAGSAIELGLDSKNPRLLQIAEKFSGAERDYLKNMQQTLDLIIKRISDFNKENALYTQSALRVLNGSMNEIKETLTGQKVYGKKGKMADKTSNSAGSFVSKEA